MKELAPVQAKSKFERMLAGEVPPPVAIPVSAPPAVSSSPPPTVPSPTPPPTAKTSSGDSGNGSSIRSSSSASHPQSTARSGKQDPSRTKMRTALSALTIDQRDRPDSAHRSGIPWGWVLVTSLVVAGVMLGVLWPYLKAGSAVVTTNHSPTTAGAGAKVMSSQASVPAGMPVYEGSGKIVSDRKVNVATKVSGQIVEMLVEQGDRIQAGDVIARLEDVVYKAAYDQAQAQCAEAKGQLARAQAQRMRGEADKKRAEAEVQRTEFTATAAKERLEQLEAQMVFLEWNAERVSKLAEGKLAGEVESRNARSQAEAQRNAIEGAKADMSGAEKAVETSRASLAVITAELAGSAADVERATASLAAAEANFRLQTKRLADCTVTAPIGGVILERNAQVGDFVAAEGGFGGNANSQFVTIADTERLRVEVDVNEKDIKLLKTGMPCRVSAAADPGKSYDGFIMWIDPGANYDKAQVQVKVRILQPDQTLKIEGAATVRFGVGTATASRPASQAL